MTHKGLILPTYSSLQCVSMLRTAVALILTLWFEPEGRESFWLEPYQLSETPVGPGSQSSGPCEHSGLAWQEFFGSEKGVILFSAWSPKREVHWTRFQMWKGICQAKRRKSHVQMYRSIEGVVYLGSIWYYWGEDWQEMNPGLEKFVLSMNWYLMYFSDINSHEAKNKKIQGWL